MGSDGLEMYYSNGRMPTSARKGSFWWKDNLKNLQGFKLMAQVQIRDGTTCLFWKDRWGQQSLELSHPELFSFAENKNISVAAAFQHEELTGLLQLPISEVAYTQLQFVVQETMHLQLN
jgi:hypothetical protein